MDTGLVGGGNPFSAISLCQPPKLAGVGMASGHGVKRFVLDPSPGPDTVCLSRWAGNPFRTDGRLGGEEGGGGLHDSRHWEPE